MVNTPLKLLSTVHFKDFDKWDYKSYSSSVALSKYKIDKLGKHILNQVEKVNLFEFPDKFFGILGISNSIGMYDAYSELGVNFNQPYKNVKDGFIAYNPFRINVGSIGIKTKKVNHSLISPAYVVISCKSSIIPEYLFILMKSEYFNEQINNKTTGSVRQSLTFQNLSEIKVPIPELETQKQIVEKYNLKLEKANSKFQRAKFLESEIDIVLFDELGIKKIVPEEKNERKIKMVRFRKLIKWGADINLATVNPKDMFVSNKFKNVPLASVAQINPTTNFVINQNKNFKVTFLPMECISDIYGEIIIRFIGDTSKVKGYTRFKENDVLWAKITPCMQNGKCAIAVNLENGLGYGSTEFHIVRVNEEKLTSQYIYCLLRTKLIRDVAQYYFSGSSGQQRVGAEFLQNLIIPLPPINSDNENEATQEKIVNIIFKLKEEIKYCRKESERLFELAKKEFEEDVFNGK